jgi:hypothetical protein
MAKFSEIGTSVLTPEAKLLLYCARMRMDDQTAKQIIALMQGRIDWDRLLKMAVDHEVTALVHRSLDAVVRTSIPDAVRCELKKQIHGDVQVNLSLTRELLRLMNVFDQCGIPVIAYKGPVIAMSVYHDLAARPFSDLDILVREENIFESIDLLRSQGYEIVRPESLTQTPNNLQALWIQQLVKRSPWAYQLIFWNADRQTMVELHWRLTPGYVFSKNPEELWQNLTSIPFGNLTVQSFAPENLLWFLCLHASKHDWMQLRWLCDVAELIRAYPDLSWEKLAEQAKMLRVERRLYLGLFLANHLLDSPIPLSIQERIDHLPQVKDLAAQVITKSLHFAAPDAEFFGIGQFLFQLKTMDRAVDRARYLLRPINGLENAFTRQPPFGEPISLFSLSARFLKLRT